MAEDDIKSNIGAADAADEGQASAEPRGPKVPKPPKKFGRGLGLVHDVIYGSRFANNSAWIQSVTVDGQPLGSLRSVKVGPGSEIIVIGGGLNNIDVWEIKQAVKLSPDPFSKRILTSDRVILNLSDVIGGVVDGAFEIYLFSTKYGGGMRKLPVWFLYEKVEESKDQSKARQAGEGGEESPEERARAAAAKAAMEVFTEAGEKSMEAAVGGTVAGLKMGQGASVLSKPAQTAQTSGAASAKSDTQTQAEFDADTDIGYEESTEGISGGEAEVESSAQATVRATPGTIKQSAELVGEYIDKRPEIIAHAPTRQKVLSSLQSGDLGTLNAEERASLQAAIKGITSAPAGVSAQLRTSAEMVGDVSARITAEAAVEAEAKVSGEAKVSAETEISGQAEIKAEGQAPAGASLNLKQSAEMVGEYLDKNPQAIPDIAARGRILAALQSGDISNLPPEDKQLLIKVLEQAAIMPGQPAKMQAAMSMVAKAAAGGPGVAPDEPSPVEEKPAEGAVEPSLIEKKPTGLEALSEDERVEGAEREGRGERGEAKPEEPAISVPSEVQEEIDKLRAREKSLPGLTSRQPPPGSPAGAPAPPAAVVSPGVLGEKIPPGQTMPGKEAVEPSFGKEGDKDLPEKLPEKSQVPAASLPAGEADRAGKKGEKMPQKAGPLAPSKPEEKPTRPSALSSGKDLRAKKLPAFGKRFGGALAKQKLLGKASGRLWDIAAGTAYAGGFTLLGFYLGMLGMDAYWIAHRRAKDLFPMAIWKKIVTVLTNLLGIGVPLVLVMIIWYTGCNYPGKGKLSVIGSVSLDACQALDSLASATRGALGGTVPPPQAPPGALCAPVPVGPASPSALAATCFGQNAAAASIIVGAESGGDPGKASRVDVCTGDGAVVSWGLFQINLSAHAIGGLDCPRAFSKMYTGSNRDCRVANQTLYQQCVQAASDPSQNIQRACEISGNGSNWNAWALTKNKCGL